MTVYIGSVATVVLGMLFSLLEDPIAPINTICVALWKLISFITVLLMVNSHGIATRCILQVSYKEGDAQQNDPWERAAPIMFETSNRNADDLRQFLPNGCIAQYQGNDAIRQILVIQAAFTYYGISPLNNCNFGACSCTIPY